MRFLLKVTYDIDVGNKLAREGALGSTIKSILADLKPEAAYFLAQDGKRSGILIVDLHDASQIPAVAEPWFLALNAAIEFTPVMVPEDLGNAEPAIAAAAEKFG